MANVFSLSTPVHPIAPMPRHIGMAKFTCAVGAVTYATATGGLPVTAASLTAMLDDQGIEQQVKAGDIYAITCRTTIGHMGVATKQADDSWKIKLWNGTTEIADGSTTVTLEGELFFTAGSPD